VLLLTAKLHRSEQSYSQQS